MTLNKLIEKLQKLAEEGHGELAVFCVSSSSGAAYELQSTHIDSVTGREEAGPFLEVGAKFINISGR